MFARVRWVNFQRPGWVSFGSPLTTQNVDNAEADLKSGRGVRIPLASALPGDLDIEADNVHIGVCMTPQCTVVYSNSTSNQAFMDSTGPSIFLPASAPGKIYRLLK